MKNILLFILVCISLVNCTQQTNWAFKKEILLNDIHPIGITFFENQIWLSDGNGNRLVQIDSNGSILQEVKGFERPMHISSKDGKLLVPEYGRDTISIIKSDLSKSFLQTPKLDAPAGVHQWKNEIAIADFYNHQVLFKKENQWITIGKKGTNNGKFNYPTDVQITEDYIYVADAYNHRVQLFNKNGNHIKTIGEGFNMNASTGIYVSGKLLYITDFENNRVIITNIKGELIKTLKISIEKPTDILIINDVLWVLNFKKGSISLYTH